MVSRQFGGQHREVCGQSSLQGPGVEAQNPIADHLKRDPVDPGRLKANDRTKVFSVNVSATTTCNFWSLRAVGLCLPYIIPEVEPVNTEVAFRPR